MFNKVFLIGNLVRTCSLKVSNNGLLYCRNTLAVNRTIKRGGNTVNEAMFIDLTMFDNVARFCCDYCHKGTRVLIEGTLIQDNWTGQDGTPKTKHSIQVISLKSLSPKTEGNTSQHESQQPQNNNNVIDCSNAEEIPIEKVNKMLHESYEIPF